ncbi:interferon-induced transmembrane protein 1-like [Nelusetta ayraudi]|uniref:interferon-induced transmembrane protein 1-like n=1 Tax=Nelusetta ayraudi TaxID=303726 RepID=UPI003F7237E7
MDVEGGRPAPGVQMQDYQQQPGGELAPPLVQYTAVTMVAETPKDHIIWSLCLFVYCNPCFLGLVALIFSIKARDRKMMGDLQEAQRYGSTARIINIVATVLLCLIVTACVIYYAIAIIKSVAIIKTISRPNGY